MSDEAQGRTPKKIAGSAFLCGVTAVPIPESDWSKVPEPDWLVWSGGAGAGLGAGIKLELSQNWQGKRIKE